mgnify:CR=1 FL=1
MFEIIQPYLLEIIVAILTGIASFIGVKVKKAYEEYINTKTTNNILSNLSNIPPCPGIKLE